MVLKSSDSPAQQDQDVDAGLYLAIRGEDPQRYCRTCGMNQVKCGMDDIEKEVESSKVGWQKLTGQIN